MVIILFFFTISDNQSEWLAFHKIPASSLRTLFSRFVDLNAPPSQETLRVLAAASTNKEDIKRLTNLSEVK